MRAAQTLLERGIFLQGIRPPTVPEGRCRLRATVMSEHDPQELAAAAQTILDILREQS
jgi:glycine C-acetyltransferase/8-amino-7-oxononanoate synthase